MSQSPVIITGIGLASSLGGLIPAAAAFRAGMDRCTLQEQLVVDLPDGEQAMIRGHAARPLAEGFEHVGCWLRMAEQAMVDLRASAAVTDVAWAACWRDAALVVVVPHIDDERFGFIDATPFPEVDRLFVQPLLRRLRCPAPRVQVIISTGAVGGVQAIHQLQSLIDAGQVQRGFIVAVDSLLERGSIEWLTAQGRVKLPSNPIGLIPGEAAVWLALESAEARLLPSSGIVVEGVAVESAPVIDEANESLSAVGESSPTALAQRWHACLSKLLPPDSSGAPFDVDHYVDATGEEWRSLAWGHLQPRIHRHLGFATGRAWHPASGFGATGAASGILGCALAVRAWARGYARAERAVVWTMSEDGSAGLIVVRKA